MEYGVIVIGPFNLRILYFAILYHSLPQLIKRLTWQLKILMLQLFRTYSWPVFFFFKGKTSQVSREILIDTAHLVLM